MKITKCPGGPNDPLPIAETSLQAIDRKKFARQEDKIFEWLKRRGGRGTTFEACDFLGKEKSMVSGRFSQLQKEGKVEKSGEKMRDPKTGYYANVWKVKKYPVSPPPIVRKAVIL